MPDTSKTIKIAINQNIGGTESPIGPLIRQVVSYPRTSFTLHETGVKFKHEYGPFFDDYAAFFYDYAPFFDDSDGIVTFPAGFIPRVRSILERQGYRVVLDEATPPRQLKENAHLLQELNAEELQILEAIQANPRGQIRVKSFRQKLRLIEIVCRFYPKAKVLIVGTTKEHAKQLFDQLRRPVRFRVGLQTHQESARGHRCVVTTAASQYIYGNWDVVLYSDPAILTNARFRKRAMNCGGRRIYGLTDSIAPSSHRDRLTIEAFCGPEIYRSTKTVASKPTVEVFLVESPWIPAPDADTALARKRQGFWHNQSRNATIAAVAAAMSQGDLRALWKHGLLLDELGGLEQKAAPRRVTVVVESPEHGRELLLQLPGWRLVDARDLGSNPNPTLDRTIVTELALARVAQIGEDVLVWLCESPWNTESKRFTNGSLTVVDLMDDFDKRASDACESRVAVYRERGWLVTGGQRWTRCPA